MREAFSIISVFVIELILWKGDILLDEICGKFHEQIIE